MTDPDQTPETMSTNGPIWFVLDPAAKGCDRADP
jgi:hypothetical protein